jgi:hypothetical protein
MFNLQNKVIKTMKDHSKACLVIILILFVFNASYAFGEEVLLVVGKKDLRAGDIAIKNHLKNRDFNITIREDTIVKGDDALDKDLVILSESARSKEVSNQFRDVAVPVICSEPWLFSNLGMTGQTKKIDFGRKSHQKKMKVINPNHPLCASCSGEVQVCSKCFFMGWGVPGENAIVVATLPKDPDKCTIFAYDAGAKMPEGIAPARRVGLYLFRNTANSLTAEGWALFDAAVDWSISKPQPTSMIKLQSKNAKKT